MPVSTFTEFQSRTASEKVGLVIMEAAKRLVGWSLFSGSVYRITLTNAVIVSIVENGTTLTSVANSTLITAGKYYYDRDSAYLYLQATDSSSPDSRFIALTFKYFFSNVPATAPYDLASGFEVEFIPMLDEKASFNVAIESTKNLLGVAISNNSTITFKNDQSFWSEIYDKVTFESHRVSIYSWTRDLPISEAKLIYKGVVSSRNYSTTEVKFDLIDFLDELRSPVTASLLSAYAGTIRIPDSLLNTFQRVVYGYVYGHVPTPIDQVLSTGYPVTGTVTATLGSVNISGIGSLFLRELTPGDDLLIGTGQKVSIQSVTDDTHAVLTATFPSDTQTNAAATIIPQKARRWQNRNFLIAGHALSQPSTTVTSVIDGSQFFVADTSLFQEGDSVQSGTYQGVIRVLGTGFMKLVQAFGAAPAVSSTITLPPVSNVKIGSNLLTFTRDFTYNATTALLTLTDTAEFNVAVDRNLYGTITVTNGSRSVTGVGTQFRTQLAVCDWVRLGTASTYFEVLEVVDDVTLTLRTTPGAGDAGSGAGVFKHPDVYDRNSVLTCDVLGKPSSGNLIRYAGGIAKDLLTTAGLSAYLDTSTFDAVDTLLPHRLGFAVPSTYQAKVLPSLRDTLNLVCRSTFVSVVLSKDFLLQINALEPGYTSTPPIFAEADILNLTIASDSSQIIAQANVNYGAKEYDTTSSASLTRTATYANDRFLSTTSKQFTIDTCLVDLDDASIFASRWAFLLDIAPAEITVSSGMQAARLQINDIVSLSHEKLYKRLASNQKTRIGAVLSLTKTISGVQFILSDFGNAFARCARIADDSALDFSSAADSDKLINGYQTDANGLTDASTSGINLIW